MKFFKTTDGSIAIVLSQEEGNQLIETIGAKMQSKSQSTDPDPVARLGKTNKQLYKELKSHYGLSTFSRKDSFVKELQRKLFVPDVGTSLNQLAKRGLVTLNRSEDRERISSITIIK